MSDVREQPTDQDNTAAGVGTAEDPTTADRSSQETRVRSAETRSASAEARAEAGRGDATEVSNEEVADVAPADNPSAADLSSADVSGAEVSDAEVSAADESADDDDENTLEGEAEIAADYLEELLDIADLDGDIDTYIEGERAHVSIVSESRVLVGDRGEVLDALQELTRLAVMTETGERSRLMLDVAGFRERRRKQLMSAATSAVERAKSTNAAVPLEPMNPFERKIVHDAVAAAGLSSASEGDEPQRHVVVQPQA